MEIILKTASKEFCSPYLPSSNSRPNLKGFALEYERMYLDLNEISKYAIKLTNGHCIYCGIKCFENNTKITNFEFDHFYPISWGNIFTFGNAVLACRDCNNKKSNEDPFKFAQEHIYNSNENSSHFESFEEFCSFMSEEISKYKKDFPALCNETIKSKEYFDNMSKKENLDFALKLFQEDISKEPQKEKVSFSSEEILEVYNNISKQLATSARTHSLKRIKRTLTKLEEYSSLLHIKLSKNAFTTKDFYILSRLLLNDNSLISKRSSGGTTSHDVRKALEGLSKSWNLFADVPSHLEAQKGF